MSMTDYTEDIYRLGLLGQTIERITEDKSSYLSKMGIVELYYNVQKRVEENEKDDEELQAELQATLEKSVKETSATETAPPAPDTQTTPPAVPKTVVPLLDYTFPDNRMGVLARAFHVLHTEYVSSVNEGNHDGCADYLRLHTWVKKLT